MDFQPEIKLLKFEFRFEQYIKVVWTCVKVIPLNRWDFYNNLATRIIAFGLILNPMEFLQNSQKNKRKKATVQLGQNSCSAQA